MLLETNYDLKNRYMHIDYVEEITGQKLHFGMYFGRIADFTDYSRESFHYTKAVSGKAREIRRKGGK